MTYRRIISYLIRYYDFTFAHRIRCSRIGRVDVRPTSHGYAAASGRAAVEASAIRNGRTMRRRIGTNTSRCGRIEIQMLPCQCVNTDVLRSDTWRRYEHSSGKANLPEAVHNLTQDLPRQPRRPPTSDFQASHLNPITPSTQHSKRCHIASMLGRRNARSG